MNILSNHRNKQTVYKTLTIWGVLYSLSFFLITIFSLTSHAQTEEYVPSENNEYYLGEFVIPATQKEQSLLNEADSLHWEKIQELSGQVIELESEIEALEREGKAEVAKLLTPEQKQAIEKQRLASMQESIAENITFLRDFTTFAEQLAGAKTIEVYEGLPRANSKKINEITERARTFKVDEFDFYSEPLTVDEVSKEQLRETLVGYQRFELTSGGKFCGGFHTDLLLKYKIDGKEHRVHICLGCSELRVFGPNQTFEFDFNRQAWDKIAEVAQSVMVHRNLG